MQALTTDELRERFLAFFEANGHRRFPSDGLVPSDDPTVLFTSAGMNQFKPYFLGKKTLDARYRGAASCQKCLRTGDLDNVGRTPSHHSFFEMLGNFSFGVYFKREAIGWAWEFLTGYLTFSGGGRSRTPRLCLDLPREKLWVSIHREDDEAHDLWRALGVPEERIQRFGDDKNFWPANARVEGPNGPCGPCSEIYYHPEDKVDEEESVEIWNLVFTQYDRRADGTLAPLPRKNIDTGMGLERLARVIQGKTSNFDTDILAPIVQAARKCVPTTSVMFVDERGRNEDPASIYCAIADHVRAVTFLIADGVVPSNEKQGYVLRMLIRRTMRCAAQGNHLFVSRLVPTVIEVMKKSYPELVSQQDRIQEIVLQEERQSAETLALGEAKLIEYYEKKKREGLKVLSGEFVFKLWDTHGYPFELTAASAASRGFRIEQDVFDRLMEEQRDRSRRASKMPGAVFVETFASVVEQLNRRTDFLGYGALEATARVEAILGEGHPIDRAERGQTAWLITDRTPCYGESGGQQGDQGLGHSDRGRFTILDTQRVGQTIVHQIAMDDGAVSARDAVTLSVDRARRLRLARHHTATHLLHSALRRVLGEHVQQAGSLVAPDRLRLDFLHSADVEECHLRRAEEMVNEWIWRNEEVAWSEMSIEEARRAGALAFFGEKYGDRVRVVSIGDVSKELCGGTHAGQTGELGFFRIVSEGSVAAGTRRVEALAGDTAYRQAVAQEQLLQQIARQLNAPAERLSQVVEELAGRVRRFEKELGQLRLQVIASSASAGSTPPTKRIGPLQVLVQRVDGGGVEILRKAADELRRKTKADVVVLGSGTDSAFFVASSGGAAIQAGVKASDLIQHITPLVGGNGGGRPDFAQGGGTDVEQLDLALAAASAWIEQRVAK